MLEKKIVSSSHGNKLKAEIFVAMGMGFFLQYWPSIGRKNSTIINKKGVLHFLHPSWGWNVKKKHRELYLMGPKYMWVEISLMEDQHA